MPDISMCMGHNCPNKNECYRFTAKPNPFRQSFFVAAPFDHESKSCDHFWDNSEYSNESKQKHDSKKVS